MVNVLFDFNVHAFPETKNKRIFVTQEYTESKKMSSALHLTSIEALF